uniref:Uncharacterized protein n=1 Tax=viral metagenome TaxID=1070528 RepID=A0A6C0LRE6_9ZZZZ
MTITAFGGSGSVGTNGGTGGSVDIIIASPPAGGTAGTGVGGNGNPGLYSFSGAGGGGNNNIAGLNGGNVLEYQGGQSGVVGGGGGASLFANGANIGQSGILGSGGGGAIPSPFTEPGNGGNGFVTINYFLV